MGIKPRDPQAHGPVSCPPAWVLLKFKVGDLADDAILELEAHLAECQPCSTALEALDPGGDQLVAMLRRTQRVEVAHDQTRDQKKGLQARAAHGRREPNTSEAVGSTAPATESRGGTAGGGCGRFRPVRPHGEGGLGIVCVAIDTELNREVALKQIKDRHADDLASRRRFLREAEITGGLEHPGIVPVYGLGTDDDGRPYYAMRFIRGDSLKEAIEQFHGEPGRVSAGSPTKTRGAPASPLAFRKLLRRFTDVCNAVAYAHSRCVIHRDIKPSNIILGKHGETSLIDWGLAKPTGRVADEPGSDETALLPSTASGSAETLPGSALGTPAYMSPEQARGEINELVPLSDVYSLGATLYCILTGKPPFEGETPQVLQAVQAGIFQRPRRSSTWVDPALEAVCLKAMARNPESRYESSKALAEDLERWMADEPVSAWREPFFRRARRWARRHRTAVVGIAAAFLVGLVGTGAVLAVQTEANRNLQSANRKLVAANLTVTQTNDELKTANERTRQRFDLAMEAIKLFHGEVSQDLLLKERLFERLRTRLLRGAADFYAKLEELLQPETDLASRAALSQAYEELGSLTDRIADKSAALALHEKALAVRRELAARPEATAAARLDLVRSLLQVGATQGEIGQTNRAQATYEEARRLAEGLHATADASRAGPVMEILSSVYMLIGQLWFDLGKYSDALAFWEKSASIHQVQLAANPNQHMIRLALAAIDGRIGRALEGVNRPSEALASWEKARAIQQALVDGDAENTDFQTGLALCHHHIGDLLMSAGRLPQALAVLETARTIQQKLVDSYPNVTQFQRELVRTHQSIGALCPKLGRASEGLASLEKAQAIMESVVKASPTSDDFQNELMISRTMVANVHLDAGRPAQAVAIYRDSITILERLPVLWGTLYNLASLHALLAATASRPGSGLSAADAQMEADRAMTLLRKTAAPGSVNVNWMRKDPDLDVLRARTDFQLLMMDLLMPGNSFAPSGE